MKIKVVTLCSGYDSQCLALERLKRDYPDFDYELVAWAEYDPESKQPIEKQPAVIAHNALFPQWADRNMGDITTCDWSKVTDNVDLLFCSTPCQSISNSGLQEGFKEGSGTKSSVIWSVLNAIKILRPKYLLMENVANMVSKKFINDFHEWQKAVSTFGYTHYTDVLNAKDYGIPQNRKRVFMVSTLYGEYEFPEKLPLEKQVIDILDKEVDESYYLKGNKLPDSTYGIINDTFTGEYPVIYGWSRNNDGTIKNWHPVNAANCVTVAKRENTQNYIKEVDGRVRKLTTNECFRLMGVDDKDIDKIQSSGISNSSQYKLAGNSIVVDTLYYLLKQLLITNTNEEPEEIQLKLF